MTLFIPRKQNMVAPNIIDAAKEMADNPTARPNPAVIPGLGDPIGRSSVPSGPSPEFGQSVDPHHLEQVLRQNFLAIQNWANLRTVSAAVNGSTLESLPSNVWTQPSFDAVGWDYNSIASTSAQKMVVPEAGIYVLGIGVAFSAIPGQTHLEVAMNGGIYPQQHGFVSGSTANTWTAMIGGSQQKFRKGFVITPAVFAAMPGATDSCLIRLEEFSLTKIADIPSKVQ